MVINSNTRESCEVITVLYVDGINVNILDVILHYHFCKISPLGKVGIVCIISCCM